MIRRNAPPKGLVGKAFAPYIAETAIANQTFPSCTRFRLHLDIFSDRSICIAATLQWNIVMSDFALQVGAFCIAGVVVPFLFLLYQPRPFTIAERTLYGAATGGLAMGAIVLLLWPFTGESPGALWGLSIPVGTVFALPASLIAALLEKWLERRHRD